MRAYVVPGTVHIYTYINTHPYTSGAFSNNPYKNQGYADEVAYFASFQLSSSVFSPDDFFL